MKLALEDIDSITELIPQRSPIVCIDRLIAVDENFATSTFEIPEDFLFAKNHHITAAGLLENAAQTAAAKAGYFNRINQRHVGLGYIASFKKVEFISYPEVGSKLISTVTTLQIALNMSVFHIEILSNENIVLTGVMNIISEENNL